MNVPAEYVSALRGDGHHVTYCNDVDALGPTARDEEIAAYAADREYAILSTDVKDFGHSEVDAAVFVAPQNRSGGDVRAAIARIQAMSFDPAGTEPIWLSNV